MRRGDHDLAVEHAACRQAREQRVVQFREIAVERPRIAALDEELAAAAEDQSAEAVPFRLEQVVVPVRQLLGELREHRLDRRRDGI